MTLAQWLYYRLMERRLQLRTAEEPSEGHPASARSAPSILFGYALELFNKILPTVELRVDGKVGCIFDLFLQLSFWLLKPCNIKHFVV